MVSLFIGLLVKTLLVYWLIIGLLICQLVTISEIVDWSVVCFVLFFGQLVSLFNLLFNFVGYIVGW